MQDYYKTMKRMIFTSVALVFFVPFILTIGIGYYYFANSLRTSTITCLKQIVSDHCQMIDSFLSQRQANLEYAIASCSFEVISQPEQLRKVSYLLQRESNAFVDLGVFNEAGVHLVYDGPYKLAGKNYAEADWFKEVMKQGHYISDVYLGYRRIPHFIIAVAREAKGKKWVLRATIDTHMFNDLVRTARIGETGEAYIVNADGIFQTEPLFGGHLLEKDPDYKKYPIDESGIKTFVAEDAGGDEYLYVTTHLKDKHWLLVARQKKADAFSALRSAGLLIALVAIIGAAVMVGAAFYVSDRIVRRMEEMDSEKEGLSQQLVRASRLAEIGEMATGIAHEINNPLQIMKSEQALIDMLLSELKEKGELKESESLTEMEDSMQQIAYQIGRASKITHSILRFGRKEESVAKDVDLRAMIPDVTDMIAKRATVEGIDIKQDISEDTPSVHVDPSQLQQVFVNLFNNAIDAIVMRHGPQGGKLVIESGQGKNGKAEITVTDNGSGISPENVKKIFSPFFTTKPVGKGTGLGLSVCFGIVENMGGVMDVRSEEGVGTTFTITLPAAS